MQAGRCRRLSFATAAFVALSSLTLAPGCSRKPPARPEVVRPVKTMIVSSDEEERTRSFPGKAEASKRVELAFQVSGLLTNLTVKEGQNVAKGEVIAQLRQDEFTARLKVLQGQLDQARAELRALRAGVRVEERLRLEGDVRAAEARFANARAENTRYQQLLRSNAISSADAERATRDMSVAQEALNTARQLRDKGVTGRDEDIDAKEAQVRGLEARVVESNIQMDDSTLRAPYDRVIAQRFVEQNQNVMAKQPIVKFQDVDEIDVAVDVPEAVMAADILTADFLRMEARVSGAPGLEFPVHIKEVAQRADPVTQTFRVLVAFKAPPAGVNILPGMTATVTVTYRRAGILGSSILIPVSAVTKDGSSAQIVWIVNADQTITRRPVKVGEATGGRLEVLDGLQPGDRIAVAGVSFLRGSMKVNDLGDSPGGRP